MAKKAGFFQRLINRVQEIFTPEKIVPPVPPTPPSPPTPQRPPEPPKPDPISQLITRLQPVIDEANARWDVLDQYDLRSTAISRALEESGSRGFSISQLTDKGEIIAEATRARVFLQDQTSTKEGAELYTQQESYLQWKGQFGNEYNNWQNKFKSFNTDVIDEATARVAFRAYRMLEETEASRIGTGAGEGVYGSENMIIAMYDIALQQGYNDESNDEQAYDLAGMGFDLLERTLGQQRYEMDRNFEESNRVADILDVIEWEERYF